VFIPYFLVQCAAMGLLVAFSGGDRNSVFIVHNDRLDTAQM
jgi:hypothetical protein